MTSDARHRDCQRACVTHEGRGNHRVQFRTKIRQEIAEIDLWRSSHKRTTPDPRRTSTDSRSSHKHNSVALHTSPPLAEKACVTAMLFALCAPHFASGHFVNVPTAADEFGCMQGGRVLAGRTLPVGPYQAGVRGALPHRPLVHGVRVVDNCKGQPRKQPMRAVVGTDRVYPPIVQSHLPG